MPAIRMVTIKNPFNRKERDVQDLEFRGETIAQLKDRYLPINLEVIISINGMVITEPFWNTCVPSLGDEIVFMPVVSGGGDDKQILGTVLMIALVVAVGYYDPGVMMFGSGTLAAALTNAAIIGVGGILINSMMPKPQTPKLSFDTEQSQVYSWSPQTVQRQGLVKPKFYGKNKLFGNVISVYSEPDDTDNTKQTLKMLIALGLGPVKGITKSDGSNYDVRINGQLAQNYEDVTIEEKKGTLEQSAVSLFSDTKPEYRPNRVVTNAGGSIIYTTPDNDFDNLEIELLFDRGVYYANDGGGLSNHSIDIKIEISEHDADSWSILINDTITDNVTGAIRKSYTASESYAGGTPVTINRGTKYDIRVSKDTADKSSSRYGDRLILGAIREVMEDGFKHPGLSFLAIQALATDQISGALEVDVIQEAAVVRVYDDVAETWSIEYNTNPAWVLFDALTQPIISGDGDGTPYAVEGYEGISPNRLDLGSFVVLADFCDDLVPDGNGGTEKRITFNGGFDTGTTLWEAALKTCEVARCILIQDGVNFSVAVDKATTATQMFNVGNIVKDSFQQTFLPQAERASEIEIHYTDAEQDFKRVPFSIYNSSAGDFENKITLELLGVTKQSEAFRAGMFRLAQNIALKSTVEFEVDIDALACTVGDVVYIQHDVPDWKEGGRIVSATNNTVTIDKEVTPSGGTDKVLIRVYNPITEAEEIETHTVSGVVGKVITITDTWTTNPSSGDLYCYGTSDDIARKYRITQLSRSSEQIIKINGIEYNPDIYDWDSDSPIIPISDYDTPVSSDDATKLTTLDVIRREYPKSIVGLPTMDIPITHNLTFSGNAVDTVSWSKTDSVNPILLTYKGVTYEITASNTTSKYIYWDKNDSNNTFKSTNVLANAISVDKWLMCYNESGTAYEAWGRKIIHGGLIQADTVTANQIAANAITAIKINANEITAAKLYVDGEAVIPNLVAVATGGKSLYHDVAEDTWSRVQDNSNCYTEYWDADVDFSSFYLDAEADKFQFKLYLSGKWAGNHVPSRAYALLRMFLKDINGTKVWESPVKVVPVYAVGAYTDEGVWTDYTLQDSGEISLGTYFNPDEEVTPGYVLGVEGCRFVSYTLTIYTKTKGPTYITLVGEDGSIKRTT